MQEAFGRALIQVRGGFGRLRVEAAQEHPEPGVEPGGPALRLGHPGADADVRRCRRHCRSFARVPVSRD
ncbi:hypothetical protein GCM10020000_52580 [Streptomyces olivoverticillatus]